MMLAAALMLGEGLGERPAAETLSGCGRADAAAEDDGHATARFGDRVLAELPHGLRFEFGGAVA